LLKNKEKKMPAPYSIDLRKKVVETYKSQRITLIDLAQRFKISLNSAKRYVQLERKTGDVAPNLLGKGRPGKITESGYKLIQEIIGKNPTITLDELSALFYKEKKVKVNRSILSRACKKLNLRRKKLSRYAAEQERGDVKKNAKSTLKK
jgi:transposase